MINELNVECKKIPILVDNQTAIEITSNSKCNDHQRFDVKHHVTRDVLNRGEIDVIYVKSKEGVYADNLVLIFSTFFRCCSKARSV